MRLRDRRGVGEAIGALIILLVAVALGLGLYIYSTRFFASAGSSHQLQVSEDQKSVEEAFTVTEVYCETCLVTLNASEVDVSKGVASGSKTDLDIVDDGYFTVTAQPVYFTLTLRPDGDGTTNQWVPFPGGSSRWEVVDETIRDDADYIYNSGENDVQLFSLEDRQAEMGIISNVTVVVWAQTNETYIGEEVNVEGMNITVRTGSQEYCGGDTFRPEVGQYKEYVSYWPNSPSTDLSWTWEEIDGLEAGVKTVKSGLIWNSTIQNVTQIYVNVTYYQYFVEYDVSYLLPADLEEELVHNVNVLQYAYLNESVEEAGVYIYNHSDGSWQPLMYISVVDPEFRMENPCEPSDYVNGDGINLTVRAMSYTEAFETHHDWLVVILGVKRQASQNLTIYVYNYGSREVVISSIYVDGQHVASPELTVKVYEQAEIPVRDVPESGRIVIVTSKGNRYECEYGPPRLYQR